MMFLMLYQTNLRSILLIYENLEFLEFGVETSVVEIARGVPETRAVPTTKTSETLSPQGPTCSIDTILEGCHM